MIGYVRPDVEELKVKELKLYRSYYCGICTSLSRKYGPLSRLFLSYDATFMAILEDAFGKEEPLFGKARCPLPPFQKKKIVVKNNAIELGMDISQLGVKLKLDDLKRDKKHLKKMFILLLAFFFAKSGNSLFEKVKDDVDEMVFYEISESSNPHEAAHAFGKAVEKMINFESAHQELSLLMYLIGEWVYLVDALDDIEEDIESGAYNPFVLKYKNSFGVQKGDFSKYVRTNEKEQLNFLISRIQEEFLKVEKFMLRNSELVRNVIFFGIPKVTLRVLNKKEGDKE
ncbi:DUF5685 family protein [Mesoaciditoga sp.]